MNLFKCVGVVFCAILLCGCLESKGEFEAINVGKISAVYENGTLRILDSPCGNLSLDKHSADLGFFGVSQTQSLVSTPKNPKNHESHTENPSVVLNAPKSSLRGSGEARALQTKDTPPQTPPARGGAYFDSPSLAEGARGWVESTKNPPFILFFFTTTCGVCKAQIPILQEIAQELANENIKIYGILGNAPSVDLAQQYARENAISLPIFYENSARRFFSQIVGGVKGVPVIVIFKDGKIDKRFIGLTPKSVLKRAII